MIEVGAEEPHADVRLAAREVEDVGAGEQLDGHLRVTVREGREAGREVAAPEELRRREPHGAAQRVFSRVHGALEGEDGGLDPADSPARAPRPPG